MAEQRKTGKQEMASMGAKTKHRVQKLGSMTKKKGDTAK